MNENKKTSQKVLLIGIIIVLAVTATTITQLYFLQKQKVTEILRDTAQNISESFLIFLDRSADILIVQEMADVYQAATQFEVKLTDLEVRNHKNLPDEWEQKQLKIFKDDPAISLYYERTSQKGEEGLRLMTPLRINQACLKCHGEPKGEIDERGFPKEGLKIGDLAGAISITIPVEYASPFIEFQNLILWIGAVFVLILLLFAIYLFCQMNTNAIQLK